MKINILIADDDISISNLIEIYLKNEGYIVDKAKDGLEALELVEKNNYNMLILDIMMPNLDGINLCIKIREKYNIPILFLSAKDLEINKIEGLTVGGDDYITKPFSCLELIARVRAQIRRYTKYNDSKKNNNIIQIDELIINCEKREVSIKNKFVKLTPKEYSILECLALNKGNVLTIENLYESVWKEEFVVSDTAITVHITNLRHKLEVEPKNPQYIKTVWGVGYKI